MLATKSHLLAAVTIATTMLGALVLFAGEGCTVLTNDALPDDAGVFDGGGDAAALDACGTCLAAACVAPAALCLTSDACAGVVDCGGDAGCVCAAGSDGGPSADRLHHAYTACFDAKIASCATDCAAQNRAPATIAACASDAGASGTDAGASGTDAGPSDAEPSDAGTPGTDACVACAAGSCASGVASCGSGSECEAFLACSAACTTSSCITDCGTLHATGKVAASELATCTATSCKNDCGL